MISLFSRFIPALVVTFLGGFSFASAALTNPLANTNSLADLLAAVLGLIVQLGTFALVFMLVYVGFLFVVAQGNDEKLRSARSALVWTVIGGLVLLGAQAISMVIQSTINAL